MNEERQEGRKDNRRRKKVENKKIKKKKNENKIITIQGMKKVQREEK